MKIRGNTVGVPNPQPDWNQTDPKKANYIRNKPSVGESESGGSGGSGSDGFSPIATVEQTNTGAIITIIDKKGTTTATVTNGKDGQDGYTPQKGVDYFTEKDKTEMVNAVIAALPIYDGSVV